MPDSDEVWEPIPEYEDLYKISSHGSVWSKERTVAHGSRKKSIGGIMLTQYQAKTGYLVVNLCRGGDCRQVCVHQLVARAFLGEPPGVVGIEKGEWQVNHKNGDKADNRVDNLEWVTEKQNKIHAANNGLYRKGEEVGNAKLTHENVCEARALRRDYGIKYSRLASKYGVHITVIRKAVIGEKWGHVTDVAPVDQPNRTSPQQTREFVRVVKEHLSETGITQTQLADNIGVPLSTLSTPLRDHVDRRVSYATYIAVMEYLE